MLTSTVTGIRYEESDIVRIFNPIQIGRYIKHNAKVVDMGVNEDGKLFVCFYRKSVASLFDLWVKHQLN